MKKANLSVGKTSNPVLEPNQKGEYTFTFDLGAFKKKILKSELHLPPTN